MLVITLPPPPRSTLFPYTTLFRSRAGGEGARRWPPRDHAAASAAQRARPAAGGRHQQRGERVGQQMPQHDRAVDRKSTRLNSSHMSISYAVFCLKKKKKKKKPQVG